jgi:hypothetical protein
MKLGNNTTLALLVFSSGCAGISITSNTDGMALAAAIFNSVGVVVDSAAFSGAKYAAGSFTDGPFGIGSGGILTSGSATGALPGGSVHVANGAAGSIYCGPNTNDGSVLTAKIEVQAGYSGILVQFILGSQESAP